MGLTPQLMAQVSIQLGSSASEDRGMQLVERLELIVVSIQLGSSASEDFTSPLDEAILIQVSIQLGSSASEDYLDAHNPKKLKNGFHSIGFLSE